jgi:hypothetical protein
MSRLIDVDSQTTQVVLCHLDFGHELLVCLGYVVEGHHIPAEAEKEEGAERDKRPERKL